MPCLPPGRTGGLPRRSPLRTVRATRRGIRLKQAAGACRLAVLSPASAGAEPASAGGVHEAGLIIVRWAGSPVVDEVVRGYRLTGDLLPPVFPVVRGLRRLVGGEQVIPAQRTARILPGEQAQGVIVQRGLDLSPPFGPVVGQGGVIG